MGVIDEIYEAFFDDEAFAALPAQLASSLGARSMILQTFRADQPPELAFSYFTDEMLGFYAEHELYHDDLWSNLAIEQGRFGTVLAIDDYISRDAFRRTRMFNECFRRFGDDTGVCLGAVMPLATGMVSIGAHRAIDAAPFGAEEAARLEEILPHIRRLVRAREALALARGQAAAAESVLDVLSPAVMLVDAAGRMRFANVQAQEMLQAGDGLSLLRGALSADAPSCAARLEQAIRTAALRREGQGDALVVARPSGSPAYRLIVLPHPPRSGGPSLALVLIDDPARRDPGLAWRLTRMFGMTEAEADLAVRLLDGLSPEEAADARDVRVSTVRSQIKSLLTKTETDRIGALLATLGRIPRVTG